MKFIFILSRPSVPVFVKSGTSELFTKIALHQVACLEKMQIQIQIQIQNTNTNTNTKSQHNHHSLQGARNLAGISYDVLFIGTNRGKVIRSFLLKLNLSTFLLKVVKILVDPTNPDLASSDLQVNITLLQIEN